MSVISLSRLPITVKTTTAFPFNFRVMSGQEQLGRLFQYDLQLSSQIPHIDYTKVLGQSLTVALPLDIALTRYFNGIIVRFSEAGRDGELFRYHATICPQLWLLTRNRDCRVFQGVAVPDVVKLILQNGKVTVDDTLLVGQYRKWEYLTQYRESDFDFVSRIMEHEGIYYYFQHGDGVHTMVLADSPGAHKPRTGYDEVPLGSPDWPPGLARPDYLETWNIAHQIQASGVSLDDYDFRLHKGANLVAAKSEKPEQPHGLLERFEFPGRYLLDEDKAQADLKATQDAGAEYARVRLERERTDLERIESSGNVRGLETGAIFGIRNIVELETTQFLVTATQIYMSHPIGESGHDQGSDTFQVTVTAMDNERSYRPARVTPKPTIQGPQTARVVGDPGTGPDEQIVTDPYGRIKVHFFWDRHAPSTPQPPADPNAPGFVDHGNSCFVRVATPWAGSNWGSIHIPRIGQEVVVQFLDGDPDRPIVTGSVYNVDNMPPYTLPDNKTQSGIKSRSTPKGTPSNFNEIRFEDKKGAEEVYVHAERDHNVMVEANRTVTVGGNETITVSGTRTTTVTKKDTVLIKDEHAMTVDKSVSQNFKNGHILNVYAYDQEIFVEAGKTEEVKKKYDLTTDEEFHLNQGDSDLNFKGNEVKLKAGASISIESPTKIEIKVGESSSITLTPTSVEIKGLQISVVASTSATVEGKATVDVKSGGATSIKGAMVNINS